MTAVAQWVCPSCQGVVSTAYCPDCSERPLHPQELTLRGLGVQAFEALTDVDGRLLCSLRDVTTRPGVLTVAYAEGRRKPFIGPVSLFLVANVVFFAVESLTGSTIFSTPPETLDQAGGVLLLGGTFVCLYRAIGVVYAARGGTRIALAALLTLVIAAIVLGYRFALFVLGVYTS